MNERARGGKCGGGTYFDLAGLEGAKEELLEETTKEERADEAEVG